MEEVVYSKERCTRVLDIGVYRGFDYVIVTYGMHPCAYVRVPDSHEYYGKDTDEIPVECHGGITYAEHGLPQIGRKYGYYIGWDYGHCGDYVCLPFCNEENRKKWTVNEIFEEVKNVVSQLKKVEKGE